jgi:NAD-dependent dihydropyrimidine dehydrogenase PreA subunit
MSRPLWFVELLKQAYPGRFLAARLTKLPILGYVVDRLFFDGDHLVYLPKNRVIQVNQPVDIPGDMVLPSEVVEHFIERANYHWIMNACICRAAEGCRDYPVDLGCLFLGEAVLGINPRLGRLVAREEALEHVQRCQEAGLVHLIGRNKLDTIWLGVGSGDRLLTICNCCPCCCLWRVLPYMARQISSKIKRMPGVIVMVNHRCAGCGTCTRDVCFVDAIHVLDGQAAISDACRGCGRCISVCPHEAIEMSIEYDQLAEESIAHISQLVDVS